MNLNKKLWSNQQAKESNNKLLEKFNNSFSYDFRLWEQDIKVSLTHIQMLLQQRIISESDHQQIKQGLQQIQQEISSNSQEWFRRFSEHEDIHTAIELRLTELIGDPGKKLHTARSRNDQVATDLRLWLREKQQSMQKQLIQLLKTFVDLAERDCDQIFPGYTHLQAAQPLSLGHYWLAHYERISRDLDRLQDFSKRLLICPLGSGALAGTSYDIDRDFTAQSLGFLRPSDNSLDSVSDRDFVAEYQFVCSLLIVHLSQLAEEIILWTSQEFAFMKLDKRMATGSSMMPQKLNPDVPELIRGKSGRILGNLQAILVTLKGLPLAYNKDLQEDKEMLFDTCDNVAICLDIILEFLLSLQLNTEKINQSIERGFLNATDGADYLVKRQVPFREAYRAMAEAVEFCIAKNYQLSDLSLSQWKNFHESFEEDIVEAISLRRCLMSRQSHGGTSPIKVREQINNYRAQLQQR